MNRSEQLAKLLDALSKAQGGFKPITKNKTASVTSKRTGATYTYKYADLPDIITAVSEALSKNGLSVAQPPIVIDGNFFIETFLGHSSGEWIQGIYPLPDPNAVTAQEMGSAITYARRYSLCSMLGIAADEDEDAQTASARPPRNSPEPRNAGKPAPSVSKPTQPARPATAKPPVIKPNQPQPPKPQEAPTEPMATKVERLAVIAAADAQKWTHTQVSAYTKLVFSKTMITNLTKKQADTLLSTIKLTPASGFDELMKSTTQAGK